MTTIDVKPGDTSASGMTIREGDTMTVESGGYSYGNRLEGGIVTLINGGQVQALELHSGLLNGSGDYNVFNGLTMTGGRFEMPDKALVYGDTKISDGTVVTPGYYQTTRPIFYYDGNTRLEITGGTVYLPHGQPMNHINPNTILPITLQSPAVLVIDSHDLAHYRFNVPDGQGFCINFTDLNNDVSSIRSIVNTENGIQINYLDGTAIDINGHFPPVSWSTDGIGNTLELFAGTIDSVIYPFDPSANGMTLHKGDKLTFQIGSRGGDTAGNIVDGGTIQLNTNVYLRDTIMRSGLIYGSGDSSQIDNFTMSGGKLQVRNDTFFSGTITISGGTVDTYGYSDSTSPTFRYDAGTRFVITGGDVLLPAGMPTNGFTKRLKIDLKSPAHFQAYSRDLANYHFNVAPGSGFRIDLIDIKGGDNSVNSIDNVADGLWVTMSNGSHFFIYGDFPSGEVRFDYGGRDGGVEIFTGAINLSVAKDDTSGNRHTLSSGDVITFQDNAHGYGNTLVGGEIVLNTNAYLGHTTVNSGKLTVNGGAIDWLTLNGGTLNIANASSIFGQIVITGGTVTSTGRSWNGENIFYYNSGTRFTIVGGTVRLPSARPATEGGGPLSVTLRAPGVFQVNSSDLNNYAFDMPDGCFRIDLLDRKFTPDAIKSISNVDGGVRVYFQDGTSILIKGNFPSDVHWHADAKGEIELYAGNIVTIVYKGQTSGDHLFVNPGDKLIFMEGSGGSYSVINGGIVQLNKNVVFQHMTMNSGLIYASNTGSFIIDFTMNNGTWEVRSDTALYGEINIAGGRVDTYGFGQGNDPIFWYDNGTVLNITGGEVLLPIAKPVMDTVGRLKVRLSPDAQFEVYSSSLENLYFETNGNDFHIDIMDVLYGPRSITQIQRTEDGYAIQLDNKEWVRLHGDFAGMEWRKGWRNGTIELYACFAEGTLIDTPEGKRPVETLDVGCLVRTATGATPITWIGHKTVNLHGPVEDECFLIRVLRGAFAENVPSRDLWLTPEHCVYVDGGLVPIRCLVNEGSIDYDRSRRHYTYYHFTLAAHEIVYAEDLPSETYRPNRERRRFDSAEPSLSATEARTSLAYHTAPEAIRAAWTVFASRSAVLNKPVPLTAHSTRALRQVHVVTDTGERASFVALTGAKARFAVPPGAKYIAIESEASRPDHDIGPYIDDRRCLGVRVGPVQINEHGRSRRIEQHLHAGSLPGWNNIEDGRSRWTSGKGIIPLKAYGRHRTQVDIEVEFPDVSDLAFGPEQPIRS